MTYETLDALILAAIGRRSNPLYAGDVNKEAERLAYLMGRELFRVRDGRIQSLRKAGRIVHRTKAQANGMGGWHLVKAK